MKFLLVDSHEIFREGLAKLLEGELSIEVVYTCRTGSEAIVKATEHDVDIIVIDIELPECDGIEAIRHIHERLPNANIIVLTYSLAEADVVSSINAGARAYLFKDIYLENLIKTVDLVGANDVIISNPMAAKILVGISTLGNRKGIAIMGNIKLSKREQTVLSLVAKGFTNKEIAANLSISENTAKVHLRNAMEKLEAHNRQQAVAYAVEKGHILGISLTK